ncbi:MAG TPA: hypothetical protein VEW04_02090 [Allosphingosinicella sp.]|nr:hypothetical protein [Allosphingosinicella sp.]
MHAPRKGDLDRIGPFHPYLVYAAIVLLDLAGLAIIVLLLIGAIDWIENLF